jgi:hypothetical protein
VPAPGGAARGSPVQERRHGEGDDEDSGEAEQAVRIAAFGRKGEVQEPAAAVVGRGHGRPLQVFFRLPPRVAKNRGGVELKRLSTPPFYS